MEVLYGVYGTELYYGHCGLLLPCTFHAKSNYLTNTEIMAKETARKSLEELDFLLSKDRTVWISRDRQAPKVGAIIDRDMAHGDAVADFEGKGTEAAHADYVENEAQTVVDNMLLISLDT